MSAAAGWAIDALIASTLLMIAVLAVRGPVRRQFGAQVAYTLWALPVLRLALPPLPSGWGQAAATPITRAGETITILMVDAPGPVAAVTPAGPGIGLSLAVLWGVGAAAFLGWHLVRHALFCRRVLARGRAVETIDGVRVIASDGAVGPLAFGVVRRYVAFPRDFADRYEPEERALALAHELGHHARGDLVANWVALGVLGIHWFNPVAWRAFRAFRADQELANDARVLARCGPAQRHAYACAIVKAAHGGAVSAACHLHTITDLKGRLRMLTLSPASRGRVAAGITAVAALVVAGLGLTASGSSAAAITSRVGETVGVDLGQSVPPAPPALPTIPHAPLPPEPPVPPVPGTGSETNSVSVTKVDGRTVRTKVIHARDGESVTYLAGMPEISSRDCVDGRDGPPRHYVVHGKNGAKNVMIICTNRIDKAAEEGAAQGIAMAANSRQVERRALQTALSSLSVGRAAIENDRNLTPDQRREALDGLTRGEAQIRDDLAKAN